MDQELVLNLALFLVNFLSGSFGRTLFLISPAMLILGSRTTAHLRLVENPENKDVLLNAHLYLVKVCLTVSGGRYHIA